VDLEARSLYEQTRRVKLQDQPFQVLALLLERPGELISREELRRRLWAADTLVDFDHGLNIAINKLRKPWTTPPMNRDSSRPCRAVVTGSWCTAV